MNVACSTAVFCQRRLAEALAGIRELGFTYTDILLIEGWVHVNPSEMAADWNGTTQKVDSLLKDNGLKPIAFNSGLSVKLYDRSDESLRRMFLELDAVSRFAERHGVAASALQPPAKPPGGSWSDLITKSMATLKELTERASEHSLTLGLECHAHTLFEDPATVVGLLDEAPWLSLAYDPTHFVMNGVELGATLPLLQRAAHVHLRDAARGKLQVPPGEGEVDFDWILGNLQDSGYTGDVSIECLENDQWDVTDDAKRLREMIETRLA